MKKLLSILLICVMCVSFAGCSSTTTTVEESEESSLEFRLPEWVSWGMKEGEVRQHFSATEVVSESGNWIYHRDYISGWGCGLEKHYGISDDNALLGVKYIYTYRETYELEPKTFEIFSELKDEMSEEYGTPFSEDEKWINDKYKGDEYMMNKAADEGDYISQLVWQTEKGFCALSLNVDVCITYMPDSSELPNYTEK